MSFGFGSGFGSNNNNNNNQAQQGSGFGGFGSNNTSSGTGFGQQTQQSGGFGATPSNTAGGGLFGNNSSGFGSGGSGFGTSSAPFGGNKSGFGNATTSEGGLFGATTATTGGSGFGGGFGSNATPPASGFGQSNNNASAGGLFGNTPKPAFGAAASTGGGSLFGGGTGGGFGATSQPAGGFGAAQGTALGGNTADSQGTGGTPFQAHTEKDGPGSSQTNHFQSISFMPPYQKFSFEELRLADYNQGRRYGNGSGQAGAFGTSTGFGGFGSQQQNSNPSTGFGSQNSTGGGMFGGGQSTTSTPFGGTGTTQPTGGFGAATPATGGGLFGSGSKPATTGGGLFGGSSTFGAQNTSGFGGSGGSNTGGLFGNNSNQNNQQKPGGFAFGGNNASSAATGFGGTATASGGGGLFGGQQSTGFGGQSQQAGGSSLFGQQNQNQNQAQSGFGNNNQQKPGGLFGNTNTTGGGLFGNSNTASTGGGLFGNNNQANQQQPAAAGGLFGNSNNNNQQQPAGGGLFGTAKPATGTGGGLFGSTPNNNHNAGGGLFGNLGNNNQNQQNQGSSIFGNTNTNNQQQKPGGLFGGTGTTGTGLFNNTNNNQQQPAGGSLFGGGNNQNQTQGGGLFGSLGNNNNTNNSSLLSSTQQNNPLQPPQAMTASILDQNPYGSSSIFNGLPPPPQSSPGPIATPISSGYKPKKNAVLPQYKINPLMASRLNTPQRRGYGFSYSTYGTPASVSSNVSTPGGFSSSLLGGSLGRGLGKSLSTSNLRRNFDNDGESVLTPGAFSAGSTRYSGTGSMKKLHIDRSLRTDLFTSPPAAALPSIDKNDPSRQSSILKKKVSFDATAVGGSNNEPASSSNGDVPSDNVAGESNSTSSATPSAKEQGFLRSSSRTNGRPNGARLNGPPAAPEMEQVKGNELAIVPEDGSPEASGPSIPNFRSRLDATPGAYYMRPSKEELKSMPREKLKALSGFTIGREGCGSCHFEKPVDLTTTDLDSFFPITAKIEVRSLTVYPNNDKKPPVGKALNVPSLITLANSWPRERDRRTPVYEKAGGKVTKHVERLKRVMETEFVSYNIEKGEWAFRVPHFTTYALNYDDDESELDSLQSSMISLPPDTPTPRSRMPKPKYTPLPSQALGSSILSDESSRASLGVDDTFEFKKKKVFPGAFDGTGDIDDDMEMEEVRSNGEPFLDERSAISPPENGADEPSDFRESEKAPEGKSLITQGDGGDRDIVGSYPAETERDHEPRNSMKSILKSGQHGVPLWLSPLKGQTSDDDDVCDDAWTRKLHNTISPKKQDRQTLRHSQGQFLIDDGTEAEVTSPSHVPRDKDGFATSIDLMNSLFGQEEARRNRHVVKPVKQDAKQNRPHSKGSKALDDSVMEMSESDVEFHKSFKPTWGSRETISFALARHSQLSASTSKYKKLGLSDAKPPFVSDNGTIRFLRFMKSHDVVSGTLHYQRSRSVIRLEDGVPYAEAQAMEFSKLRDVTTEEQVYERSIWNLANILFDEFDDEISESVPADERSSHAHLILKDRLSTFWQELCEDQSRQAVAAAPSAEERAVAHLSGGKITQACHNLLDSKDYHLANLIAQIGSDRVMQTEISNQLDEWRQFSALSEMTEPIRALYGLLAGNACLCEGKKGPPEDRASTFVISERFKLDWKRAFGLRLWYAILRDEPVEAAVQRFATELGGSETRKPTPSFSKEDSSSQPENQHGNNREDVLWGLMKIFADHQYNKSSTKLTDVVMPQNTSGNPTDLRLSFQLYHALGSRSPALMDSAKGDQLALEFATQLEAAGNAHMATFALMHLSNSQQRQHAIQSLLARHAASVPDPDSPSCSTLMKEFQIPAAWIWEAKALYARTVRKDHVREVECLLKSENWSEAHSTLCQIVAPQAIIEQDHLTLQHLIATFTMKDKVSTWSSGGQVYEDYLCLVDRRDVSNQKAALERLLNILPKLAGNTKGFIQKVAVQEMSLVIGKKILEDKQNATSKSRILQLPLTKDTHVKHSLDLSLKYYGALMAGGR